jgi:hypothetical protein
MRNTAAIERPAISWAAGRTRRRRSHTGRQRGAVAVPQEGQQVVAEARQLAAGLADEVHAAALELLAPVLEDVMTDQHAEQAHDQQGQDAAGDEEHRLEAKRHRDTSARMTPIAMPLIIEGSVTHRIRRTIGLRDGRNGRRAAGAGRRDRFGREARALTARPTGAGLRDGAAGVKLGPRRGRLLPTRRGHEAAGGWIPLAGRARSRAGR